MAKVKVARRPVRIYIIIYGLLAKQWLGMPRMDVRQTVGVNVRKRRLAAGMSQEELAGLMQVEQGYISSLEAGRRNPTIATMAKAAFALNIDIELLFRAVRTASGRKGD